jgi:exopolysaccharide production protein ExoQ
MPTTVIMTHAGDRVRRPCFPRSLHPRDPPAIGCVADRDLRRAQLKLSLALSIILYNYLEGYWMRGFEPLGVVFVIVAAEIGRYWRPFPLREAAYGSRSPRAGSPGPLPGARSPWLRIRLS